MKIVTFSGALFLYSFLIVPVIQAVEISPGLRFACLSTQYCRDGTTGSQSCSIQSPHRVMLTPGTSNGLLNDPNTYVTECLQVDENGDGIYESICTTGSAQLDHELFCGTDPICTNDNLARLQNNPSVKYSLNRKSGDGIYFKINGSFIKQSSAAKVATDALGHIIPPVIEWQSSTETKLVRRFLLWNKIPAPVPQPTSSGTEPTIQPNGIGGQQQGSLTFPFQDPSVNTPPSSDCSGVAWDPFGRTFDIRTLEPVPEAQVVLKQLDPIANMFDQAYANKNNPHITNPDSTGKDGMYSFVVVDGTYDLVPSHPSYTHASGDVNRLTGISPNVTKMYSDFYFSQTHITDPIIQKGKIQHRDIPLEPANGTGYRYPLNLMDAYENPVEKELNGTVKTVIYGGVVSHPFADLVVEVCSMSTGAEICRRATTYDQTNGGPDKNGVFAIKLNQYELQSGEYYKKLFIAVDLTRKPLSFGTSLLNWIASLVNTWDVNAQESRRSLTVISNPILSYLEGYAYSADGSLLTDTRVMIYVKYSPQPIFTTRSDSNGYYKITSEHLPRSQYTIRYEAVSQASYQTEITTSQFLTQNASYISEQKIDPFLFTTDESDPRKDIRPIFTPDTQIEPVTGAKEILTPVRYESAVSPAPIHPIKSIQRLQSNRMLMIGVALIMISITGAIGAFLILKKQSHHY